MAFCRETETRNRAFRGCTVSLILVAVGILSLLADLGRPAAAYLVFVSPRPTYITFGSYALAALVGCTVFLMVYFVSDLPRFIRKVAPFVQGIGLAAALYVMVYTGLFLEDLSSVALWDSPFLPALFFVSSLSAGVSLAGACRLLWSNPTRGSTRAAIRPDYAGFVCLVLETLCAAGHIAFVGCRPGGAGIVAPLLLEEYALTFYLGFVGCSIAVPAVCKIVGICRRCESWVIWTETVCVLVGGFCLRFVMVNAGMHAA